MTGKGGHLAWVMVAWVASVAFAAEQPPAGPAPVVPDDVLGPPARRAWLVHQGRRERMRQERRLVAAEIRHCLTYAQDRRDLACEMLVRESAENLQENIHQICRALATADPAFGKAFRLFEAGRYRQAALSLMNVADSRHATFLSAAKHYLLGEALLRDQHLRYALEAYGKIAVEMSDRVSFAAVACLRAAETYESLKSGYYALRMYEYLQENFGPTLDAGQASFVAGRVNKLKPEYGRDADRTAADPEPGDLALPASERLPASEAARQRQIAALMRDVVRHLESCSKDADVRDEAGGPAFEPKAPPAVREPDMPDPAPVAPTPGAPR